MPTLVLNGKYDEADDLAIGPYFWEIPHSKWVEFAESAHFPNLEQRELYMRTVNDFLKH